ncbi:MAG: PD40 domain-containing protein [Planctomycetes bacterium]|nr:PD40 domain-containing protein [Planctomycetota bacterium]MBI3847659.1 PD40 domain-containing protein [Planctomycetota bacterium]
MMTPKGIGTWLVAVAAVWSGRALAQFTIRASVDSSGRQASNASWDASISEDGTRVAFMSLAYNLVADDSNGEEDVFVRDLLAGTTVRASVATDGTQSNGRSESPVISGDGRWVAFASTAGNLDPSGDSGIFVRDLAAGTTRLLVANRPEGSVHSPALSYDARFLAYLRYLFDPRARAHEIHVLEIATGIDQTIGNAYDINASPSLSRDGRYVAWESVSVVGYTRCAVHDGVTGAIAFGDVRSDGAPGDGISIGPSLSADGSLIAFSSQSTNLIDGDTNGSWDVFVHDFRSGTTTRVSVDSAGHQGSGHSRGAAMSADGHYVAFRSNAPNLVASDSNGHPDVFLYNRRTGTVQPMSVDARGQFGNGSASTGRLSVSFIGPHVAFAADASNLVPDDNNVTGDIFVRSVRGLRLVRVAPSLGSESGGELVHLSGSDFTTIEDTAVTFGGQLATIVQISPDRILVRTPPGSGVVDVVVANRYGASVRRGAFSYVAPELAARYGNVNVALGDREDVLLLNALSGDAVIRELRFRVGQALSLVMAPPSSRSTARFVLYAWQSFPNADSLVALRGGGGYLVFPPPFSPRTPQPIAVWNNLGHARTLGAATLPSHAAPSIVVSMPGGAPRPARVTFQGLIEDAGSGVPQGVSVTNALLVRFTP